MSHPIKAAAVAGATVAALTASVAGAMVGFPKPELYRVAPDTKCRATIATFHYPQGQSGPAKKRITIPPAPGLQATALSKSMVQIDWSLGQALAACRTRSLLLSIGRYDDWLPKTLYVDTHGSLTGSMRMSWYAPSTPPDVALASAVMNDGRRSRVVGVLIGR
jgi:hypothetical protein